ncbi:hypothetical protein [Hyphomonas sp.]|uniref:hypothetical protein n=1 Tax=Hyphomonas sp. TaxID=87 RepID=UPI003566B7B5
MIRGETFTQQYYACLVLALFIGLSAILAIRAVYEVDMAVGQYRTGGDILTFCIAGPPHLELTGRCNSVNCLEAKASLIYDARGLQDIYDNNCTVPAEAPRS